MGTQDTLGIQAKEDPALKKNKKKKPPLKKKKTIFTPCSLVLRLNT